MKIKWNKDFIDKNKEKHIKSFNSFTGSKTESNISPKKDYEGEVINMKLFYKQEKKMRDELKICSLKKKSYIGKFHSLILQDNYNNLDLTETKPETTKLSQTLYDNPCYKESKSILKEMGNRDIKSKESMNNCKTIKKEKKNKNDKGVIYSFELDKMIKKKIPLLNQIYVSKEKLSTIVDKTKSVFLLQYTENVSREKMVRINENVQSSIDAYKDCITNLNNIKSFFDEEFLNQMDSFIKFLDFQKKSEKDILDQLNDNKLKLETEIKQIEYKIDKQRYNLKQNKNYRNYLICVKERTVPVDMIDSLKKEGFLEKNKLSFYHLYKNIASSFRFNQRKSINFDRMMRQSEEKEVFNAFFECKYKDNVKIYQNSNELLGDFKKMEVQNLNLLEELNRINLLLSKIENKNLNKNQVDDFERYFNKNIKKGHSVISNLKRLNKTLKSRSLTKVNSNSSNSVTKVDSKKCLNNKKFLSKIREIYRLCVMYYSSEKIFEKKLIQSVSSTLNDQIDTKFEYLKTIEYVLRYIQSKYNKYMKENFNELISIEKQLEIQKKEQNARDQRLADKEKHEKMKKKIMERLQKNYILPKRKVMIRYPPRNIKTNSFNEIKGEKDDELKEFLTFDSNF